MGQQYTLFDLGEIRPKPRCGNCEFYSWYMLSRELIPGCLDMLDVWTEENSERLESSISYEHDAIIRAFAAFEKLGLEGGVLRSSGKIIGLFLSPQDISLAADGDL